MYGELKRGIHLDFHTMPGIEDFGRDFNAEAFADRLEKTGVRYINAFAKCNLGFCYYNTKIGVKYKGYDGDMLGELLDACHRRDIGVTAYLNFGIDHEACRTHRDYMKVGPDGRVIAEHRVSHTFRTPCVNTGYGDYIYSLVDEVLTLYPSLDGIFLDCISLTPCYGNECLEAIRAAGGDPLDPVAVAKHTRDTTLAMLRRIKERVGNRNLICNSQPYWQMRELNSHIEVECLPGGFWGYDFFPANAAYARKISDRVMYMSGRFHGGWGDFGGLRTQAAIENDLFDALSQGFTFSVGDHMHPRAALEPAVYECIGRVFDLCRTYEPYTEGAKYKAEIGVLAPIDSGFLGGEYAGVSRLLGELKYTFDILNEEMELSDYRLLILPDQMRISPRLAEKLAAFVASGKPVLSAGYGGTLPDTLAFALPEWGWSITGEDPKEATPYYQNRGENFRYAAYVGGLRFDGESDTVYADYVPAYFDRVYDGFHGLVYTPQKDPVAPMAARRGNIVHIGFKLFTAYNQYAYVAHKALVSRILSELLPDPLIKSDLPSTARVTLTESDRHTLCHVKVTTPEPRGKFAVIEEHTRYPAGATVAVRGRYEAAISVPDGTPLPSFVRDGYTEITLPEINGYLCIEIVK